MRRAALLLLALIACSDSGPERSLEGSWRGFAGNGELTLHLSDEEGIVRGTGTWASIRLAVMNGVRTDADVVLSLDARTVDETWFVFATLTETGSLSGTLDRPGVVYDSSLLLRRD